MTPSAPWLATSCAAVIFIGVAGPTCTIWRRLPPVTSVCRSSRLRCRLLLLSCTVMEVTQSGLAATSVLATAAPTLATSTVCPSPAPHLASSAVLRA